ncbi:MAG: DUF3168 domain-containing protein [Xanthobacteraceae bacterium]
MTSPTFELVAAAIAKLRATPAVTGFVGTKIYDRVPEKQDGTPNVTSPYISFGPVTGSPDDADCSDAVEVTFQVDVWSWGNGEAYGSAECHKISDAVRRALHNAELTLSVNALVTLTCELFRILRDDDGVTNHGVIQFSAVVETP